MAHSLIHYSADIPTLRRPVMIVSLDGFIDAGDAGSSAAMFLRHRWAAKPIATFDHDAFIDYRARRPTTVIDSGLLKRVEFDELRVLAAPVEAAEHDAVFLLGPEPDMKWEAFCDTVIRLSRDLGVETVISVGAYPAAAPHTRPTQIVSARNIAAGDIVPTAQKVPGYTGPVGAQVMLLHRLGAAEIPAIGLWAEVPHYISANPHPASALALVEMVQDTFGTTVDTEELELAAAAHNVQVDEAVAEHSDAAEMVERLEAHLDGGGDTEQVPSGDDLAAEIERFLSDRQE
ncbi:PAC2 family protein [Euzebya tangerina]|uniref:PAC2 family protein n=1 Tax=Euzebya tangerina TaxID=591198 RepID=UPI0013C34E1E|nr:PAC2 family protein [Euzebya tangerina]